MATANITWNACGTSSDGQYLYYGKSSIVTGTPISGTGWTLYNSAPLTNTITNASISGLDDNVEYIFNIFCHCTSSGNGPISSQGPYIKYVCPTVSIPNVNYNTINYTLTVPISANNTGTWIQKIVVTLLDSAGISQISQNNHTSPFSTSISGSFTGLSSSTTYTLQVSYSNNSNSRSNSCTSQTVTTYAACVAPTVTISNISNTTFDVAYTPISSGDTFDILVNGSAIATGLTTSPYTVTGRTANTLYTVAVRKNCATGGSATSTTQNVTTTNTATGTRIFALQFANSAGAACSASNSNAWVSNSDYALITAAGNTLVQNIRLYVDGNLTIPYTGYTFVRYNTVCSNLNASTGIVGSSSGVPQC